MKRSIRAVINHCLPSLCTICHLQSPIPLCTQCFKALPWIIQGCQYCGVPTERIESCCAMAWRTCIQKTVPALRYVSPVNRLVHSFKTDGATAAMGSIMSAWIAQLRVSYRGDQWPQQIIPIPLDRWRIFRRGFNQTHWLCQLLSTAFALPVAYDDLIKQRWTASQRTQKTGHARRHNVLNSFCYRGPALEHIALVDDVLTTGSTVQAAAQALRAAGVVRVDAWPVARTVLHIGCQ